MKETCGDTPRESIVKWAFRGAPKGGGAAAFYTLYTFYTANTATEKRQ